MVARSAKRAIPYLEIAEQQGHSEAFKELFKAHKVLATYYNALYRDEPDD
jgi:hypothetical protein